MNKAIFDFNKVELRMMLHFLDVPQEDQPNDLKQLRSLLKIFYNNYLTDYLNAYKFVIDGEFDGSMFQKIITMNEAKEVLIKEAEALKNSALGQLEQVFKKDGQKILNKILESFTKAVEIESKKFNTVKHIVKDGNKDPKEIEGVVCEEFDTLLQLAKERVNILMVGPSGAGKTHISAQIAKAMSLDYASQSCSSGVSESAFTGKLLPLGNHGKFEYVESDFIRIYENGGVFLFDEIDASDANVMVFLNQSLANDSFHCSQRFKKTLVKKHKDFVAIGAANTFGTGSDSLYTGRNSLDAATLDRFRMGTVVIGYSSVVEEALIDANILNFGRVIRKKISKNNLKKILSTRFMKDATQMKNNQDWSLDKIQDMYFADWSREEIAVIGGKLNFNKELSVEKDDIVEYKDSELYTVENLLKIGNRWTQHGNDRIYFDKVYFDKVPITTGFYYDIKNQRFDSRGLHDAKFMKDVKTVKSEIIKVLLAKQNAN